MKKAKYYLFLVLVVISQQKLWAQSEPEATQDGASEELIQGSGYEEESLPSGEEEDTSGYEESY